jgi:hypothetical protein
MAAIVARPSVVHNSDPHQHPATDDALTMYSQPLVFDVQGGMRGRLEPPPRCGSAAAWRSP